MRIINTDKIEFSIVHFSELDDELRMDSDFFVTDYLANVPTLKASAMCSLIQYGTSNSLNENNEGYPTLRLNELNNLFVDEPAKYCSTLSPEEFKNLQLLKDDVVICRTNGNPDLVGKTAILMEDTEFAFASYLFRVRTIPEKLLPHVLVCYLNTKYGRAEIDKHSMTSNQTNFSPARFKKIKIPLFANRFQKEVEKLLVEAFELKYRSNEHHKKAESILFDALGIDKWEDDLIDIEFENSSIKSVDVVNTGSLSEIFSKNRMDGEFWLPKFEQAEKVLSNDGNFKPLSSIANIQKGVQARTPEDGDIPYASIKDCNNLSISTDEYTNADKVVLAAPKELAFAITGATIGKVALNDTDENIAISGDLLRISANDVSPYYLLTVLSSPMITDLAVRYTTGATNGHLSPKDVGDFPVPIVEQSSRDNITDNIKKMYQMRKRSAKLLSVATTAVERYIDKDEKEGLKWINENI